MVPADSLQQDLQRSLGTAFTLECELGGGGMSRVFVARDAHLGRDVVVKVLAPDLAVGVSAERFAREIRLAAALQEPHIVPVLAAGATVEGLPYYTMPFVRDRSLRDRLKEGRVPAAEAVEILRDVAKALAYAHRQGVVHRDIKPENVLLSSGTAVVTDFGIAKALAASQTHASGMTLTSVGASIGTPAYMAPEQVVGTDVDHRADLYAWGVMAYELLAGRHPFADKVSAQQLVAAHVAERPRPLREAAPTVPASLAEMVMRALEKEPAARPESARALLAALEDVVTPALSAANVTGERVGVQPPARARARRLAVGATVLVAMLAVPALLWTRREVTRPVSGGASTPAVITTVAVLPFANTGGDPKDEYFSDGMTDELANALARLPGVRVAGRTSSFAFRGTSVPPQEIGKTLDVAGIIDGSVRRSGERVRVLAQLTSTADGKVLASGTYESRATDVFAVQDSLTRAIVAALTPALRGTPAASVVSAAASRGTNDPEAYDLYLQGRYLWARRGQANLVRAAELFKQAIAKDPSFARAHAGLAMAYAVMASFARAPVDSVAPLVTAAAERALALDSTSADAHLALGFSLTNQLKLGESEAQFRAALALAPDDPVAHHWYGRLMVYEGQPAAGLDELRRAAMLDPLSATVANSIAQVYRVLRRFPEAITASHRTRELDSTFVFWRTNLAMSLVFAGQPDSAARVLDPVASDADVPPRVPSMLIFADAAAGRWKDAERLRDERVRTATGRPSSLEATITALAFGDRAAALAAVERGVEEGGDIIGDGQFVNCDPLFEPLAEERRFVAMMRRHGLGVCPPTTPWPIRPRPGAAAP